MVVSKSCWLFTSRLCCAEAEKPAAGADFKPLLEQRNSGKDGPLSH